MSAATQLLFAWRKSIRSGRWKCRHSAQRAARCQGTFGAAEAAADGHMGGGRWMGLLHLPPPVPPRAHPLYPARKRGTSVPHCAPRSQGMRLSGTGWQLRGSWQWGSPVPPAPLHCQLPKYPVQPANKPGGPTRYHSHSSRSLFRAAIKLVNTWTRLTKHSSRRKWGVCRSAPLHIVMADINSTLIILCTFQSHILKPFR